MSALREVNDSLLAEIQSLKADLDIERRRYHGTLNQLNECLRSASNLQVERDSLVAKLDAMRGQLSE